MQAGGGTKRGPKCLISSLNASDLSQASTAPSFRRYSLLSFIVPLLDKNRSAAERRIAICVFDDILNAAATVALQYLEGFVVPCIAGR